MTDNFVLITGTSSGIGAELAVKAARAGHTVIATMRNLGKADRLRESASAVSGSSTSGRWT